MENKKYYALMTLIIAVALIKQNPLEATMDKIQAVLGLIYSIVFMYLHYKIRRDEE